METNKRELMEMMAMDPDVMNNVCLNQVIIKPASYFFLKYVVALLALTMPALLDYRIKARKAEASLGPLEAHGLWKKSYLCLGFYIFLLFIAILFMETSALDIDNNPIGHEMFSMNSAFLVYFFILMLYLAIKDFHHKMPMLSGFMNSLPTWTWGTFFTELIFLGAGAVWIPMMGSWTLYRCYDFMDSVGHLIPSGSYFVWSAVMMCFFSGARKSYAGKLRLLKAESYMWFIFGSTFMIYYSAQAQGGIFWQYFHTPEQLHMLWVGDQQHSMISMCWLVAAMVSHVNVKLGYASSFHYILVAPPAVMAMFDHPKECKRAELAHKVHGLLMLSCLLFRAFDRIHEASVLMFLVGLSFISSTTCMVVWSIQNQVVEMYVFTILAGGLLYWTYCLYTLREHVFEAGDLKTSLSIEEEGKDYSRLDNPAVDEGENMTKISLSSDSRA